MEDKEAIAAAKRYVSEIFADENVGSPRLEEFEHLVDMGRRIVTLSLSRGWDTPRTRVQEVLESFGAETPLRTIHKVVTIAEDGTILSVKDRTFPAAAE